MVDVGMAMAMSPSQEQVPLMGDELTQMESLNTDAMALDPLTADSAPSDGSDEHWGKLVPMDDHGEPATVVRLMPCLADDGRRLNEVVIGRSPQSCDVVINDRRVSSRHCRLYCVPPAGAPPGPLGPLGADVEVWLEDISSNGTWINGPALHLGGRNNPRADRTYKLTSGDDLYLVNPRKLANEEEAESDSPPVCTRFTIIFNYRHGRGSLGGGAPLHPLAAGDGSGAPMRSIADEYTIMNMIGHGTSGEVRLGRNTQTGGEVAIKVVEARKFALTPGLTVQELAREAEMLRAVTHPNIIRLHDIFHGDGCLYLVMELVRGGDLFDRVIRKGQYPEDLARQLLVRVLTAVCYLHSLDIVHRDLKPENILLVSHDNDVEVKITDFGLAKRSTAGEQLKTFCGTPQYFAPEVLQRRNTVLGVGRYGKAADLWSIGIILYVLLSGTHPFHDDTLYEQIRDAYYSFEGAEWSGVSEAAKDLVCRLVTAKPEDRLTAEQALSHPFCTGETFHVPIPRTSSLHGGTSPPAPATAAAGHGATPIATVTGGASGSDTGATTTSPGADSSTSDSSAAKAGAAAVAQPGGGGGGGASGGGGGGGSAFCAAGQPMQVCSSEPGAARFAPGRGGGSSRGAGGLPCGGARRSSATGWRAW